jgi:GTP pyrophosphokinase
VKNLPVGATVIDFAYAIHTTLGESISGAKVNNKMVKISSTLKNGDIVSIIKAKKSTGPKRDWLDLVKTSLAKNRIRHFLKSKKLL